MDQDVKFSGKKFAEGVDRMLTDVKFRERLKTRPIETLPQFGIEIKDKKRAAVVARRLSRAAARRGVAEPLPNGPLVGAEVEVTVEIAVEVAAIILADKEAEGAVKAIQRANIAKMRKGLSPKR
jgi:hypothetical protein